MKNIIKFQVPIEVSARHIHLSEGDFIKLFGKNKSLKAAFSLSQKGQFASTSYVKVLSKDGTKNIVLRVLGPFRKVSQIELSLSDAYNLGYTVPLRISGDLKQAPKLKVKSNLNNILVPAIVPLRHLHVPKDISKKYKLIDGEEVLCKVNSDRQAVLEKIVVRVDEMATLALHLDTDEGNACGIQKIGKGEILKQ